MSWPYSRELTHCLVVGVLCSGLFAQGSAHAADEVVRADDRPNIVLIMADDMGYSDAGCYGGEIDTPNIDRLAAGGLRFTHFYNNALCGPTRASLLTGLYCQQVGIRGHQWTGRRDYSRCATIGELLQAAGYRTMLVGKWQDRDVANRYGFDRYFGMKAVAPISYFHEITLDSYFVDEQQVHPPDGFFLTDLLTDYSLQFLDEALAGTQPFFLYAAYVAPHWPLHARENDIAKYREKYLRAGWDSLRQQRYERQLELGLVTDDWPAASRPDEVGDWETERYKKWQAERMAVYAAQVECLDRNIGRLLSRLEEAGVMENTLILFLSDNGASKNGGAEPTDQPMVPFVQNPTWRLDGGQIRPGSSDQVMPGPADTFAAYGPAWAGVSNTPYRDFKWTAFEGGINTPLIVHWPQVIDVGGNITGQFGHVMDILPTCLDVAGSKYPETFAGRRLLPLEGTSLLPIFHGEQRAEPEALFWYVRSRAVRVGQWKLVSPDERSPWELYDLESDGTEQRDLAVDEPQRVKDLSDRYSKWANRVGIEKWAVSGD